MRHSFLIDGLLVGILFGSQPATAQSTHVVGWGCNDYGQTSAPANATNAVAIAAGYYHSLALKADGTVVGWGYDAVGETDVPTDLTNAVAVAAGSYHSLALRADDTVIAWGWNQFGQTDVPTNVTNSVAIAAGADHNLVLRADGSVVAWGDNEYGGASVPANLSNVVAIAAGTFHSLALKADGTPVSWGGVNDNTVPTGLTNAVAIAAGFYHSLALKADGTVIAWGYNNDGQTDVPVNLTNVVAIAGGAYHSLALKADGTVVGWGNDVDGEIDIPAGMTNVTAIGTGVCHGLLLMGNGSPSFTVQPWSRAAHAGTTATLIAMAVGSPPLSYQWQFNGIDIPHANDATLMLTNVQATNAGNYSVVISNAFSSITSRSVSLSVLSGLDHFSFSIITTPNNSGSPFGVTIVARDSSNAIFTPFAGTVSLHATNAAMAVSVSPTNSGTFSAGQWTGNITITTPVTNVWLVATDGDGHTGASNPFDVQIGPLHHFTWSPVSSPQYHMIPFPVTLTARDAGNNTVTGFTGFVSLTALANGAITSVEDFESGVWPHTPWVFVGGQTIGTLSTNYAHDGNYGLRDPNWTYDTGVQLNHAGDLLSWWIRTPNGPEAQGARAYLGFAASSTGCWSFVAAPNTGQIVIQRNTAYGFSTVATANQAWQTNKWYKAVVQFTTTSSVQCRLYDSDGVTLLNSLSYTNNSAFVGGVAMRSTGSWSLDTIISESGSAFAMIPTNSGNFIGGVWTGAVSVLQIATNVILRASDNAGHWGTSGQFDVLDAGVLYWQQWQMNYFGCTNCSEADANTDNDGDGFTNLQEYLAGTDPTNSASAFRIISIKQQGLTNLVTWMMGSGKTNTLQATASDGSGGYSTNGFTDIFTVTNTLGSVTNYSDPVSDANRSSLYYRVRLVP